MPPNSRWRICWRRCDLLVVMLHEDGTIALCNKHLHLLTGWSSADVAGKNWFDLMIPPEDRDKAQAAFASAKLQSEAATHYESPAAGPEGKAAGGSPGTPPACVIRRATS